MNTRNLVRADTKRREVVFQIAPNIAGYGWWSQDQLTGRQWIEFSHRGWYMHWRIPPDVEFWLRSPSNDLRNDAARKVVNVVAQFYYRVESTLRGGYC